jgi:hypothetical protein
MIAGMVRPLRSAVFAFHAAAGRWSIKYWLMRLLVLKALSKAPGSSWVKSRRRGTVAIVEEGLVVTQVLGVGTVGKIFNLA